MDDAQRLLIERTCEKLVLRFCVLVDGYRHEDLTALWTDDAVWETWRGPLRGRAAIRAYLDAKAQTDTTIHIAQNVLIDVHDERTASGTAMFTYYDTRRNDAASLVPRVVGRYFDRFALTSEGWRFAHRRTELTFTAP